MIRARVTSPGPLCAEATGALATNIRNTIPGIDRSLISFLLSHKKMAAQGCDLDCRGSSSSEGCCSN
jgi:hypothetical protein